VVSHGEVPPAARANTTHPGFTGTFNTLTPLWQSWYSDNADAARAFNMGGNKLHDLGGLELELRLASANVNLRLSSELKFVTIRNDEDDSAEPRPLERLLDGDGYHKPWISKGHGHQLVISLNIDAVLELEDEAFAQQVAAQLKNSKARDCMWAQFEYANMPF
jgi:hypothetical protein